jgi:adenosylhomocysteine nucleosidase
LGEWFVVDLEVDQRTEPVLFFHGGWGKIAAAASTQYVIDRWFPTLLINLGTCGGFEGEIDRGTIVLAERTIVYDIVEQMGDYDEHIAHFTTDLDLSWLEEDYPQKVTRTLLVSGDRDLLVEDIPRLKDQFGAVAGDWESGAIAWVADRNGIKCLILRGVTDLVGSSGGEAYGNMDLFVRNAASVLQSLIGSLPSWMARADGLELQNPVR